VGHIVVARKAVELLLEEVRLRRQNRTLAPLQHFLKFSLVKRESTAASPRKP
jgi:DNA-binding LacI/PurR family transcriptional regulator